jgi:hypothetical protein
VINVHLDEQVVRCTPLHPFWVVGRGWVAARELFAGNPLLSPTGKLVPVTNVFDNRDIEPVYNLCVANAHTYFVGTPDQKRAALVHNQSGGTTSPVTDPSGFKWVQNNHIFKQKDANGVIRVYYVNAGWLRNSNPIEIGTLDKNGVTVHGTKGGERSIHDVESNTGALTGSDWDEFFKNKGLFRAGVPPGGVGGSGAGDSNKGNQQGPQQSNLTPSETRKLGGLAGRANETVADVIRSRGGSASNVRKAAQWANKTLAEAAKAAVNGDKAAEEAIKFVKQARRLGGKF